MSEERLKHFCKSQQLTPNLIDTFFKSADNYRTNLRESEGVLRGKILATMFYEPSTRTRFSFESAMLRLGGNVISTENAREFSSAIKGETIEDTVRIVQSYSDGIVIRHYEEGAAERAAVLSKVPIINAGDGRGQHPSQSLLDIYTLKREVGRTDNLKIAMVGDLANGRTVRSLCYLLSKFQNNFIYFVAPPNLKMKSDILQHLQSQNTRFAEVEDLDAVIPEVDAVYMTRIQKERMSPEDYEKASGKYVINLDRLVRIKKEARLLHPLPRVDEIQLPVEVEQEDPRVAYFRQAENGLYVRMALLSHLLS